MVATVLLSMIILSILAVLIGSYRVAAKARYADHARYVIKSFADQFLTQAPSDSNGNLLPMFVVTQDVNGHSAGQGTGLSWTNTNPVTGAPESGTLVTNTTTGTSYYTLLLADNSGASVPVTAQVTRTVQYVDPSSGGPTLVNTTYSAGYLLVGIFTITYPFLGVQVSQSISVVRSIP